MRPDLIILDVLLPGIKGTEVATLLKKDPQAKNIPIILITAQAQKCQEQNIKETPVDFCAIKPFDFYELNNKVDGLLNISHNKVENSSLPAGRQGDKNADKEKNINNRR